MPIVFEALNEFNSSIKEIKALLKLASEHEHLSYSAILKSAILLLSAKTETFQENILNEYIEKINALKLGKDIPPELTRQHLIYKIKQTKQLTEKLEKSTKKQVTHKDDSDSMVAEFIGLSEQLSEQLKDNVTEIDRLKIPISFDYGEHGAKPVKNLFSLIGIANVFDMLNLMSVDLSSINMKEKFNTFTALRNTIIHRDEASDLSMETVNDYVTIMTLFASEIAELLTIWLVFTDRKRRAV
ncbi:MAG: HEPN domain-containing protein [Candidatus Magnetobacterium sp. LHC-1]